MTVKQLKRLLAANGQKLQPGYNYVAFSIGLPEAKVAETVALLRRKKAHVEREYRKATGERLGAVALRLPAPATVGSRADPVQQQAQRGVRHRAGTAGHRPASRCPDVELGRRRRVMFYYHVYVCYGGQDGKTVCFKSDKDLGDDEDAIVEEAIALGKMDAAEDEYRPYCRANRRERLRQHGRRCRMGIANGRSVELYKEWSERNHDMTKTMFTADRFVATQHSTAEEKAKFCVTFRQVRPRGLSPQPVQVGVLPPALQHLRAYRQLRC